MSLKINRLSLAVSAVLLSFGAIVLAPVTAEAREKEPAEWLLIQKHAEFGEVRFYFTHDAVKARISKTGCCLLARAPSWKLYYYRNDDKSMWEGSLDQLEPAGLVNPFNRSFARKRAPVVMAKSNIPYVQTRKELAVEQLGTGETCGLHYGEYSTINAKPRNYFWLTRDIPIAPGGAETICRFYGVPQMGQIPLYIRKSNTQNKLYTAERDKNKALPFLPDHGVLVQDLRSGPQVVMSTKSCVRVPYDAGQFVVPVGYKKMAAIVDVTYSNDVKDDITGLMDDLAFTTKKGQDTSRQSKNGK